MQLYIPPNDSPYKVRDGLYIGDISDAAEVLQNGAGDGGEITHVLSVLSSASINFFTEWKAGLVIPSEEIRKVYVGGEEDGSRSRKSALPAGKLLYSLERAGKDLKLVRMAVSLRDMEEENLLDYLDVCLDFIENGRKEGSVLVHCFAGVSRSAAIVTAYLMRSEKLSQEDALESLRQTHELACPNDGFLEQLKLFEQMGFKVDYGSSVYKRFRLQVLGDSYKRGEKLDASKFGTDPGAPADKISSETETTLSKETRSMPAYRCKKCRRVVALQENVLDHVPGEGETSFDWYKRTNGKPFNKSQDTDCTSIFIEPLHWMTTVKDGAMEGRLSCAHCEARLGYFNWSGVQCSCGSWITPAFQVQKCKVDISTV